MGSRHGRRKAGDGRATGAGRALAAGGLMATFALAAPIVPARADVAPSAPTQVTLVARVVATGLHGAHGLSQVGRFHVGGPFVANPEFLLATQPGHVLDPERLLVTTDAHGGAVLSIDPAAQGLAIPRDLARLPRQAGSPIQLYSLATPAFANAVHNADARTAAETAVASPRYLSLNNAFGRPWIANAPRGVQGDGTVSVTDPDGGPLANAPSDRAGGVFAGDRTPRTSVPTTAHAGWFATHFERRAAGQLTPGKLDRGAYGTAFLGASPDGTGFAVFAAITGSGAVAQVHVQDGVDGLAPAGTIALDPGDPGVVGMAFQWAPRRTLFVAEAARDQVAVLHLTDDGRQFTLDGVARLRSPWLRRPVDLAPAIPEVANPRFASHTTLSGDSDLYVANQGDGAVLRLSREGRVVARATLVRADGSPVAAGQLQAIAVSSDAQRIWLVAHAPGPGSVDELLEVRAFDAQGGFRSREDMTLEQSPVANVESGARLFARQFSPETGLGPRFNATSCESCHAGGQGANVHEQFFSRRVARMNPRTGRLVPLDGHDSVIAPRHSADGGPLPMPREANIVSLRMPLALVAAPGIDEVDDAAIEAQAVAKGDGIHGRVSRVVDATGGVHVGRYGWKADVATLDAMVAAAFADELGMPSALAPRERMADHDDGTIARAVAAFLRGRPGRPEPAPGAGAHGAQERAP